MTEQIPAKQLVALVKGKVSAKQRASDAMSHISSKLKSAKNDANLNKKAFDVVFSAFKMDEDDRVEFFDAIGLYRDFMDENDAWADGQHVGDLVKQAQAAPEMDDEQPDEDAMNAEAGERNAALLKRGISTLEDDHDKAVEAGSGNVIDLTIPASLDRRKSRKKAAEADPAAASNALNDLTESAVTH